MSPEVRDIQAKNYTLFFLDSFLNKYELENAPIPPITDKHPVRNPWVDALG